MRVGFYKNSLELKTKVTKEDYDRNCSPIIIRNFLSITFSETTQEYYYVNNEFYVSNIFQEDIRHYRDKNLADGGLDAPVIDIPEKKPPKFYIQFRK